MRRTSGGAENLEKVPSGLFFNTGSRRTPLARSFEQMEKVGVLDQETVVATSVRNQAPRVGRQ
jgi:hypothetical protein